MSATTKASPEQITVTRWRCPHCRRSWSSRRNATTHIGRCWHNPAARGCRTCQNFRAGGVNSPETCAAGLQLPAHPRQPGDTTLAVGCGAHQLADHLTTAEEAL